MTAPGTERRGVGARKMFAYALENTTGDIESTTTTAYDGLEIVGVQNLTINDPEPRRITHTGDDRIIDVDTLPPTEGMSGTFAISGQDDDLDALATPLVAHTDGEVRLFFEGTNKRGNEEQVGLLVWRQALDADGLRCYESYIFPKAVITPIASGFDDTPESRQYALTPQFATQHLWGETFNETTAGATSAQAVRMITRYPPYVEKFNGDNATTTFSLTETAVTTAYLDVYVDGTKQTTQIAKATTQIVFTTAPTTDANVVARYQYEI